MSRLASLLASLLVSMSIASLYLRTGGGVANESISNLTDFFLLRFDALDAVDVPIVPFDVYVRFLAAAEFEF